MFSLIFIHVVKWCLSICFVTKRVEHVRVEYKTRLGHRLVDFAFHLGLDI